MKLVYCRKCKDLVRLIDAEPRTCRCGLVSGQYEAGNKASYSGAGAVPVGIHDGTFAEAVENQPEVGKGPVFRACVMPKTCKAMRNKDDGKQ